MAWEQLGVSRPHVAYAVTGFALILFGTVSLFIKEKLYIGEATVATIYGLIVGPHALNWFNPTSWGNSDYITLELSRIVLIVQIFAVAVELPKKYMLKHWLSVLLLLVPVMTFGWMITSVFIWKLVPTLRWIEALCIAACVTATDPVLASAVVGKGKFAERVPGHLRNILSAESGCNDGMAFPFVYLALNVMHYEHDAPDIALHFVCISILYECVLGCIIGAVIGYTGRHLIKFAEKKNLIDRESFLVYYFCLAFFCAGVGTIVGVDDLLVAFSAGAAFSWDGWFSKRTEETHVSNVIDLLINMAYFIYFGAIVPWPQFNNAEIGLHAWKLVIIAILVLLFRRLPIVLALKPIIPDIKTWREALFSGHFGPIGVGGLFIAILARAELEDNGTIPLAELPPPGHPHYYAIATIWPITCFLVISSIIVHGSSIAVFALGKRLNNIAITMTYTTNGAGPSWIRRLNNPDGLSLKLERTGTRYSETRGKRRSRPKKAKGTSKKRGDPNKIPANLEVDLGNGKKYTKTEMFGRDRLNGKRPEDMNVFQSGRHLIVEDDEGNVVEKFDVDDAHGANVEQIKITEGVPPDPEDSTDELDSSSPPGTSSGSPRSTIHIPERGERVNAYQYDNEVVVENDDGEIIKRYRIVRNSGLSGQTSPSSGGAGGSEHQHGDRRKSASGFKGWIRRMSTTGQPEHDPAAKDGLAGEGEVTLVPVGHYKGDPEQAGDDSLRQRVEHAFDEQAIPRASGPRRAPTSPEPRSPTAMSSDEADESDAGSHGPSEYESDTDVSNEEIPFQGDEDEEDEGETEVERQRRLAALGMIPDEDEYAEAVDTEDIDPPPTATHRRINTIPEEEEKEEEQRIHFSLPEKK